MLKPVGLIQRLLIPNGNGICGEIPIRSLKAIHHSEHNAYDLIL